VTNSVADLLAIDITSFRLTVARCHSDGQELVNMSHILSYTVSQKLLKCVSMFPRQNC